MGKPRRRDEPTRIRRHWTRRAPVPILIASILGIGASQLLLEPSNPRAAPGTWEPPHDAPLARKTERTIQLDSAPPQRKAARVAKPAVAPVTSAAAHDRLKVLRDLERRDPARAAVAAAQWVHDPEELVRLNAVAVLARSTTPLAARTLASLDPQTQQLAASLQARR